MRRGNGEGITAKTMTSRHTNVSETSQRQVFVVYRTVAVRIRAHAERRVCKPTEQTVCKNLRTQIYANTASMANTLKQNVRG